MSRTTLNASAANKLVLEAFDRGWKNYVPMGEMLFSKRDPERKDEKFSVHASDGSVSSVAEDAAYPSVNVEEVGSVTLTQAVYKKKIPVTQLMKRFDNYGVVITEASNLGYDARYTMDGVMADILNNADGTTTCWDGLSLLNDSHLIGNLGTTQDNNVGGNLSSSNLQTAIQLLEEQQNHSGQIAPTTGKYLVVNPANRKLAFELIGSPEAPDTADRAKNFFHTLGIKMLSWGRITTSTSWFLINEKQHNRLQYLVGIAPKVSFVDGTKTQTGGDEFRVDFACQAGAPDYLGVVGNIV